MQGDIRGETWEEHVALEIALHFCTKLYNMLSALGNQSAMNSSYYSSGNRASMGVNGMAGMSNMSNMSGGWGM